MIPSPSTAVDAAAVGLLYQMWDTREVASTDLIARVLDEIVLAEQLGYASVWIGEHHFIRPQRAFYGRVPVPELLIARAAAAAGGMTFGTGVKVLSEVSATRAAEEMGLLDMLTDGRVEFGVGQGATGGRSDEERAQRQALYRDRLDDVLRLIEGDTSTGLPVLSTGPSPRVRGRIWAACRDEASIEHAAARGLSYVVGQAENAHSQAALVRRYRDAGGVGEARGVRAVYVAPTREAARDEFLSAFEIYESPEGITGHHGDRYNAEAIKAGYLPENPSTIDERLAQMHIVWGTPDDVTTQLLEYAEITGVDRLDLLVQFPGLDAAHTRGVLELFAHEVMPALSEAMPSTAARSAR